MVPKKVGRLILGCLANSILKLRGGRSFHTGDIESVGQRAAKLPAVKVGGLKKKSASRPRPHLNQSALVRFLAQ